MSKEMKFVQKSEYAILAVGMKEEVLHGVFYLKPPTEDDFLALEEELLTDKSLGMAELKFKLVEATPNEVKELKDRVTRHVGYLR